jgi:hypothetical protein
VTVEVVVPFRDGGCKHRRRAWQRVSVHLDGLGWPVTVADDGGEPFSRGGSLNQAFASSTADVVVACDADHLVPPDALRQAVDLAAEAPGLVQPLDVLIYTDRAETLRILGGSGFPSHPRGQHWTAPTIPLLGSCNVMSRETWELAGGWLPGFRGWGAEDIAFAHQCATLAGPLRRLPFAAVHLWHPKTGAYAARKRVKQNVALAERVAAAAGDPVAMREVIGA